MRSWDTQTGEIDRRIGELRSDELVQWHRLDVAISDEIAGHQQVQRAQREQAAARAAIAGDGREIDALLEERAKIPPQTGASGGS
jgi:hypothetical protein